MRIAAGAANKARHYTKTENTERVRTASRTVRRGTRERARGGGGEKESSSNAGV